MKKNTWKYYNEKEINELNEVSDAYKIFISSSKTEREAAKNIIKLAESQGFRNLDYYIGNNYKLTSGDKVYVNNLNKNIKAYAINAYELARKVGLNNKISTIMETIIIKLSNIVDFELAKQEMKKYAKEKIIA